MATLREIAREYKDEIMDGTAWVAIWKTGRSWNTKVFWTNIDTEKIEDEDMEEVHDIVKADKKAIFINEYYCAHMGNGTLEDIMEGIRFHYERGFNLLRDSVAYGEAEKKEEDQEQEEDMKLNKDKFLKTEVGSSMKECVTAWDKWLTEISKCRYGNIEGYGRARKAADWCQAQWEVYKMMMRQFYGIEYYFSRTDEYFKGIE